MFKFSFVIMKFIVQYMIGKSCVIELHPKLLRVQSYALSMEFSVVFQNCHMNQYDCELCEVCCSVASLTQGLPLFTLQWEQYACSRELQDICTLSFGCGTRRSAGAGDGGRAGAAVPAAQSSSVLHLHPGGSGSSAKNRLACPKSPFLQTVFMCLLRLTGSFSFILRFLVSIFTYLSYKMNTLLSFFTLLNVGAMLIFKQNIFFY